MKNMILILGVLGFAGCYRPASSVPATDGTTYVAAHGVVPVGTELWARIDATGVDGGLVQASAVADVRSADAEEVLIPQGAILYGRVVASDGAREQVVFETLEMEGTPQRIEGEVMTGGSGLTNLLKGTKVQVRLKNSISSLATVRGGTVIY